ncbi:MAG: DUF47 domain-containing protein [Acidobacteria bacterium]|nr:DUF47 domain-containing protein [Acidobacteriota bacterium]MCW5971032.1 DUF47 domain-containing protein [Blastocatellales bacterium]
MFRLLPKEDKYFDLFNRMASSLTEGGLLLQKLFHDFERHREYAEQIKQIEHKCDEITHETIRRLNQTFITPIDREDIHALASELDDVMDYIDYVARRTVLFRVEEARPHAKQLADIVVRMVSTLETAISGLERNADLVLKKCIEIHGIENEGDSLHHDAVEHLFATEKDPITLLKWKELFETLELTIDKCEDASNVLEAIVLKNS